MILLVDAMAVLWWLADDERLAPEAAASLADPANDVLVSAATIWEIEVKRAAGRLEAPTELLGDLTRAGMEGIAFTPTDAVDAASLPTHHKDPFDRMLVAQTLRLDATIVSSDPVLDAYGVNRLPA
ncbi:MAG TPA: type II toxin-antitoxin system VapC family toxin [Candidatus Limnocylindrales bacterium]|nr:type II toxin-antitoxin system VapC family toxin [Candidatus Limnocylindrales bacterium]